MTLRIFCLLKPASKCNQTYNFWVKMIFFLKKWPSPLFHTPRLSAPEKMIFFWRGGLAPLPHHTPLGAYGASPFTEILNTPLLIQGCYLISPARKCGGFTRRRCPSVRLFVCLFVCRSPVKSVKSFATWQHLTASGGLSYRLRYARYRTCLGNAFISKASLSKIVTWI